MFEKYLTNSKIEIISEQENLSVPFKLIGELQDLGIGIDIESIEKFRNSDFNRNNFSLNKIFTQDELDYCFSKIDAAPHLTVRFSAKEAIYKALNSIEEINLDFKKIEILPNEKGVPIIRSHEKFLDNFKIYISLSHCDNNAIAFAIAVKIKK